MSRLPKGDRARARLQSALGDAFTLEGELSGGGMTRVFIGTETALGRRVVLKVLSPDLATTEQVARFRREAVLAARLLHPHIVPIFSVGTVAGFLYYTMPFIAGDSLRVRLDRAPRQPVDAAVRLMREIGSALAFAHANGVVHRDVKPENIVLEHGTGRALLADFGIAFTPGEADGLTTEAGTTVGTPVYMSPEQVDGLELDGRSDIYSLGLVVWEMLTGERPWSGESTYAVMYRQKSETLPPLSHYPINVPPAIAEAIERCLAKDRDARWQSAAALLSAIRDTSDPPNTVSQSVAAAATDRGTMTHLPTPRARRQAVPAGGSWGVGEADPAMVPTVTMSAARAGQRPSADRGRPQAEPDARSGVSWMLQDEASSNWAPPSGRSGKNRREPARGRFRWVAAACLAAVVTAGIVGAATLTHPIVRWRLDGSEPATTVAPSVTAELRVDTVPADVAANDLAQVRSSAPVTDPGDTSPSAPSVRIGTVAQPLARRETRISLSHSDSVRGRAATATLALQAYQSAIAARESATSRTRPPEPDSNPVLRAPRMAAPLTPTAAPTDNVPQALTPATGGRVAAPPPAAAVRVAPQTQTPALREAQPVRVPRAP